MKLLVGQDVGSYIFDPTTNKVTFIDVENLRHGSILMVTNITRGVILYLPLDPATIATFSDNVLTLTKDCSGMDPSDVLQIFIEGEDDTTAQLLRRMLKTLEPSANVDTSNRQKVVVDNTPSVTVSTITTLTTATNAVQLNSIDARFFQGDIARAACHAQYARGLEFTP